jgi:hypothetical protein
MPRTPLALVVCCASSWLSAPVARAERDDAAAQFRAFVTKSAEEDKRWIDSWWAANLDSDPGLEHVAVLCSSGTGDDRHGYFIIEKDPTHRWELEFDVDSRTRACAKKPEGPPKWEERKHSRIDLYQGHNVGHEITSYALRLGKVVIVRDEDSDGKKSKIVEWDQVVKSKKGQYQVPERVRQL